MVAQLVSLFRKNIFLFVHFFSLAFFVYILSRLYILDFFNDSLTVQNFDVGWYKSIVKSGYVFKAGEQCNLAFFPTFPFFWKATHLPIWGICVFNAFLYLLSLIMLNNTFDIGKKRMLIICSFPSMFFCFMPYSESFFFFFSSLLLCGYYKQNMWLIFLGLFLASITRSVAPLLLAGVVVAELLSYSFVKKDLFPLIKRICFYALAVVLGILVVGLIQYFQTGKWFYFVEVQQYWGKKLVLPTLPFTTWDAHRLMWADGLSLLIGLLSIVILIFSAFKWFKNRLVISNESKALFFSLVYLGLVSLVTVFIATKDGGTGTTSIYSLNRYVFCVPFIMPLILYITSRKHPLVNKYISLGILLFLLTWGINRQSTVNIAIILFYLVLFFIYTNTNIFRRYWYVAYGTNVLLQLIMVFWFLNGYWIG